MMGMGGSRLGAALIAIPALGAAAVAQTPPAREAAGLTALAQCRSITDDSRRLACFDAAAASLVAAERTGELVVVDRARADEARRQAFGFNLPSLDIFTRRPSSEGGAREQDADRLTLTVSAASLDGSGKWILRTRENQTWRQTDDRRLARSPKAGSRFEVRKAALGSYLANVDGQTAIRVRREQ